jgi:hypothetical protein
VEPGFDVRKLGALTPVVLGGEVDDELVTLVKSGELAELDLAAGAADR